MCIKLNDVDYNLGGRFLIEKKNDNMIILKKVILMIKCQ